MNDFTKEELFSLKANIFFTRASIGNINWDDPILIKIQSMIDNYCPHTDQYEDLDNNPMRCKKCLEITG